MANQCFQVYDAHCHITQFNEPNTRKSAWKTVAFITMSTNADTLKRMKEIASAYEILDLPDACHFSGQMNLIIPGFGWHPWFSHLLYDDLTVNSIMNKDKVDIIRNKYSHYQKILAPTPSPDFIQNLPEPTSMCECIATTRLSLEKYPFAIVGEIGLDKAYRIPLQNNSLSGSSSTLITACANHGLSQYRVSMEHQISLLMAQLGLAAQLKRPVSVHGVQCHGKLFDAFERLKNASYSLGKTTCLPPRICLHSFSGGIDILTFYLNATSWPCEFYFSFSCIVNLKHSKLAELKIILNKIPSPYILVESDQFVLDEALDRSMESIVKAVCEAKSWSISQGVAILNANWKRFVFGD